MDLIELHDRALAATGDLVANVEAGQFSDPTPCPEFDVRALLSHLVAGNHRYVQIAHGEPATATPLAGDLVNDDALTPYKESAAAVSRAWSDPALLERTVQLPFGEFPGAFALGVHTVEGIVHGWDLATATGQPSELEPDLYAVAWRNTKDIDDSFRGPGRPFGPAVPVSPDATDTERLMAWLGRRPLDDAAGPTGV